MKKEIVLRLAKVKMLVKGHILNPLWLSRNRRRVNREDAKVDMLHNYFSFFYLNAVKALPYTSAERQENEKIYSIWFQGEQNAPDLVKACFASVRRHCTQELVVLDAEMLEREIDIPAVITQKFKQGKIGPAHYSDICRVELLHKYGGYWLDATCYVTAPIPDWVSDQDFFVFMAGKNIYRYSYIQNCFIRARKGSYLLECWRRMILDYWTAEDMTIDYFQHQLMFKTIVQSVPQAAALFEKMPHVDQDPTHVLWWNIRKKPYSHESFHNAVCGAFFQKTTYRDIKGQVTPGTTVYEMLYGNPEP